MVSNAVTFFSYLISTLGIDKDSYKVSYSGSSLIINISTSKYDINRSILLIYTKANLIIRATGKESLSFPISNLDSNRHNIISKLKELLYEVPSDRV